jgi:ATP-dependent DNA ligase
VPGELVCLDADGRSNFYKLLFRRDWPCFYAFDALSIEGKDLRDRPHHRTQAPAAGGDAPN